MQIIIYFLLVISNTLFFSINCDYNLTIVHISDFHSHWFEFNEHENVCSDQESRDGKCFGGFPRLLTKVRELREREKNILVLSSGEFFYGSSHNTMHGWNLAGHLLPKLKLDAMSLSNQDFGRGILELSAFLYKLEFPVLCSNMEASETSFLHSRINKSVTLNVNNEKIGIVGYLHPHAIKKSRSAVSVKLLPEIPAIKAEVHEMTARGVNKIIALGHSGFYTDLEIANQISEVDVVVGGNSDIIMEEADEKKNGAVGKYSHEKYPHVTRRDINKTLVLQLPQHGKYIGVMRITFDDSGNVIEENGERILLDRSVPQDEETLVFLKNASIVLEDVAEDYRIPNRDEVLATATALLDGKPRSCRMNECSLGNLVADALLYMFDKFSSQPNSRNVDAAIINSGMIRYSIQTGEVTVRELTHALFLGDLIEIVAINGTELKEMLEHSVEEYDITGISAPGAFLQVSGLRVVFDLSQQPKYRIKSLMIRRDNSSYTAVRSSENYLIVMPGFLRKGNDGFKNHVKVVSKFGEDDITLLINYLREIKIIKPKIDKRILFIDKDFSSSLLNKTSYEYKLSAVFEKINSSLSDLERSFLESVIFESEKEKSIPSIDALEDYFKVKVKYFLKVETISMDSHENIIPDYRERFNAQNESFDKTTNNITKTGDSPSLNITQNSSKMHVTPNNTAQNVETPNFPFKPTEADLMDAKSIHELLVHSIVQSIIDKVKKHV